jgi:adenylate kinase
VAGAADVALHLVVIGPPGAGKGTQAERFAREHGIPKISTGDILREAVASGTSLGRQVRAVMDRGELVGDELITGIVRERVSRPDVAGGFVLDGFPRTVAQAKALDEILDGKSPLIVVEMDVPEEELVRRMRNRRICAGCGRTVSLSDEAGAAQACSSCGGKLVARSDDSADVVRDRLKVYRRDTQPISVFYSSRPTYRRIDGAQTLERVRDALVAAVSSARGNQFADAEASMTARRGSKA